MCYKNYLAIAAILAFGATPAFAQSYEQTSVGTLHAKEAILDGRLTSAYNTGLIDSFELANMRRDLDAIRVKEDAYRMSNNGLTSGGYERIANRLDDFEARLMRHGTKEAVIAVPVIEV